MKANIVYINPVTEASETHVLMSDGQTVQNGIDLLDSSAFDTKLSSSLRTRTGSISASGVVVKTKRTINVRYPSQDAETGVTTINVCRFEMEVHPDLPEADTSSLVNALAGMLTYDGVYSLRHFLAIGNVDSSPDAAA